MNAGLADDLAEGVECLEGHLVLWTEQLVGLLPFRKCHLHPLMKQYNLVKQ